MLQRLFEDVLALGGTSEEPFDPAIARLKLKLADHGRCLRNDAASDPALNPQVMDDLFARGLFSLTVPCAFGGLEASLHDFVACMETVGEMGAAYAMTAVPHLCISVKSIAQLCEADTAREVLGRIRTHKRLVSFAITEDNGSDVAAITTRLTRAGDGTLRLCGRKLWITNLSRADHVVVVARCPDLHPVPGATVLVRVGTQQRGVTIGTPWHKYCTNGSDTSDLYFDAVEIAPEQLMGAPGKGLGLFHDMVQPGRLGAAAACVGMARGALTAAMADPQTPLSGQDIQPLTSAINVSSATVALTARLGDQAHADFAALVALAKHAASCQAQSVVSAVDLAYARLGRAAPATVAHATQAIGLLRLLKGPGDIIAMQTVATWLARHETMSAHPKWPLALRAATTTLAQALQALGERGGPSADPAGMLDLAELCATGWMLTAAVTAGTSITTHCKPADTRWAWQRFSKQARQVKQSVHPSSRDIAQAYAALETSRATGRLIPTELVDAPWIFPASSGIPSSALAA